MTTIAAARTNRVLDPTAESGIGAAQSSAGATLYPMVYDTAVKHSGTQSCRTDRTTTTLNVNVGVVNMTPAAFANIVRVAVTPDEQISFGGWVRCTIPLSRGRAVASWRDSGNAVVGANTLGDLVPLITDGSWTWVTLGTVAGIVPATAVTLVIQMQCLRAQGQVCVGGEQAWFDDVAMFSGATMFDSFDGNSPGAHWLGTAHRSQSRLEPWQVWNGTTLIPAYPEGQWNGSTVTPQTYVDISVV